MDDHVVGVSLLKLFLKDLVIMLEYVFVVKYGELDRSHAGGWHGAALFHLFRVGYSEVRIQF